jgi:hypothetical protein
MQWRVRYGLLTAAQVAPGFCSFLLARYALQNIKLRTAPQYHNTTVQQSQTHTHKHAYTHTHRCIRLNTWKNLSLKRKQWRKAVWFWHRTHVRVRTSQSESYQQSTMFVCNTHCTASVEFSSEWWSSTVSSSLLLNGDFDLYQSVNQQAESQSDKIFQSEMSRIIRLYIYSTIFPWRYQLALLAQLVEHSAVTSHLWYTQDDRRYRKVYGSNP